MSRLMLSFCLVVAFCLVGCGGGPSDQPDLAPVSGKVTVGGQPLSNAIVTFTPVSEGRPSSGATDAQGAFELQYTANAEGAMIGQHTVTITLVQPDDDDTPVDPSKLPPAATDGSVKKEVKAGSNDITIEL